ncbi:transaldolase [Spirochaetota bacterium]|nr:transaldolase [Spirochaetota bacterium]
MTVLEALAKHSVIVADTGDWEEIDTLAPRDVTTNPTLIYKNIEKITQLAAANESSRLGVAKNPTLMEDVLARVIASIKKAADKQTAVNLAIEQLFVTTGQLMLEKVPGRISIEVPAIYSFDKEKTVAAAKSFVAAYGKQGIASNRLLIKIAATWEGLQAAETLEKMDIHTNLTLVFSLEQAMVAADKGITLISPFVGRVTDWYKMNAQRTEPYPIAEDPGVCSVIEIYRYFKKYGYTTEIMAASFRSTEQIMALAGCDLLTIAPKFLKQLAHQEVVSQGEQPFIPIVELIKTEPRYSESAVESQISLSEAQFRWRLNQNRMATEKLREGIALFDEASEKLSQLLLKTSAGSVRMG